MKTVYENMFLGVKIDHKLNWKSHIQYVRAKVARNIGVLGKAREVLNYRSLLMLYNTLILPYLSYCLEVWGNIYSSNLQPVVLIQKRAVRIVHKVSFREHTNNLFLASGIMKLPDLVVFKTAQFMFKVRNKLLPENLLRMYRDREGGYGLRWELNFKQQSVQTTLKSMCISVCGVKIWNNLNEEIKHSINIVQFKKDSNLILWLSI